MRFGVIILCGIFSLSYGQFDFSNPYSAEQCASKLACSMNYSNVFDSKISELTYRHNLDLYKLRSFFVEKINPIEHDTEILKMNTSAMLQSFGREISNIYTTLSHDRDFINNLTHGIYDLGKSLHSEVSTRMDDVHRLVVELRGVQNNLALLQSQINQMKGANSSGAVPQIIQPAQGCKVDNETLAELADLRKNNTFLERVYSFAANSLKRMTSDLADRDRQIQILQQEIRALQSQSVNHVASSTCDSPLGVGNSSVIPDSALSASETHVNYSPAGARIGSQAGWYTNDKSRSRDWVQVDLGQKKHVTKVATQGAPCCDVRVTNYTIQYSSDGLQWKDYEENCQRKYFEGNTDQTTIKQQTLDPPLVARYVRINVADFNRKSNDANNYVGMRFELYGCSVQA